MNFGKPIMVEWDGRRRPFIDGFGLCSPTRWLPSCRAFHRPPEMKVLAEETFKLLEETVISTIGDVRREAFRLATGNMHASPFDLKVLTNLRHRWSELLESPSQALVVDDRQPFLLRRLAQWLKKFGDPDYGILVDGEDCFASGVWVDKPLPRCPQVFPEKLKHRKLDETEFNPIAFNYPSAQVSSKELEEKFKEEEQLGRMFPTTLPVLASKYGKEKVTVGSMAAIMKPDGGVRPLHDATHIVLWSITRFVMQIRYSALVLLRWHRWYGKPVNLARPLSVFLLTFVRRKGKYGRLIGHTWHADVIQRARSSGPTRSEPSG